MLVLTRQKNQRINFPGLGIAVEILDVKGSKVRVGVDAPMEVRVLRDELDDFAPPRLRAATPKAAPHVVRLPQGLRHELRNALHELSLMMHVYRKKAERAGTDRSIDARQMFEAIIKRIDELSKNGLLAPSGAADLGEASCGGALGDALVVDDDANERELLAGFLRMCDYQVRTATDGLDAIRVLEQGSPPKVVLLDMTMPRCDGKQLLRRIRETKAWDPIHVFVVSGKSPAECGIGPDDGYTCWLEKPLDPRQVVSRLAGVEKRRLAGV